MDNSAQRFKISSPNVIHEIIDDEAVLMNLNSGYYYTLNGTGTEIWDGLANGRSTAAILSSICQRYGVSANEVEKDLFSLIQQLQDDELIAPLAADEQLPVSDDTAAPPLAGRRKGYMAPQLQKYTDMTAIIQTDPIHDVDMAGWPNRRV